MRGDVPWRVDSWLHATMVEQAPQPVSQSEWRAPSVDEPFGLLAKQHKASFSSLWKPKSFQNFSSHRILWHMHETLSIDKNKINYTV